MTEVVIFIDDSPQARRTFKRRLGRIFGDDYRIVCPDVVPDLEEMLHHLEQIEDKVTYFIDEDLVHESDAQFKGSELIERIRVIDQDIPIYILTSNLASVDEPLGSIEFAIDKTSLSDNREEYQKRFFRHLKTLKKVRTEREKRFDELFSKSLAEPLTEAEKAEYDELNIVRSKVLVDEAIISTESVAELDRQSQQLKELYEELKVLKGDESGD
ncbi:hypothetical protein C1S86_08450 [Vibrio parahaemolyticus]|uniref:hypothetical protein n=1 Tax=Vibrio parahaemolyticus TaxID=670 RepID=UPI0009936B3F|nr:hypothetical protein [Vibrio parahaemolyticus]OOQ68130.1 hypothetical protein BSR61_20525 [Vibrio parahaemolyticus]PMT77153.1 hypothetical protein C1S97_10060 [Vibrio parahaemolyticus]PMT82533.1 hypothetical protein C1S86_08450 [Vibrio parahaemolyticus]